MTLYILCDGGFGNRFNSLLAGLYLAETLNQTAHILWNPNRWCDADFHELFDTDITVSHFDPTVFFHNKNICIMSHENQWGISGTFYNPQQSSWDDLVKNFTAHSGDFFYFNSLLPDWLDREMALRLLAEHAPFKSNIVEAAKTITWNKTQGAKYLGLHIRQTDIGNNLDLTPYIKFIQDNSHIPCFVCSDDKATELNLLQYPNVFTYQKTSYVEKFIDGDWNSPCQDDYGNWWPFNVKRSRESVIQAVVDLLILSNSEVIPTNLQSTFLQTACLFAQYRCYQF